MASGRKPLSVGELPEIIQLILENLDNDSSSLVSTIRVNSLWFDCSASLLWCNPPYIAFFTLPKHRLQFYASRVYDLAIGPDWVVQHDIWRDVQFKNVRRLIVTADYLNGQVPQYLGPLLQELLLSGTELEPDFFKQLNSNCPKLYKLFLDSPGNRITAEVLLDYLKSSPALRFLDLELGLDKLMTNDVLAHLGSRKILKSLRFGKVSTEMMEKMCQGGSQPFDAIFHFRSSNISAAAIPMFAGHACQSLKILELHIYEDDSTVFRAISLCRNLLLLKLDFCFKYLKVGTQDFMHLGELKKLQGLHINCSVNHELVMHDFDDYAFDNLVSSFPEMMGLSLYMHAYITQKSAQSLSKHCPLLELLLLPISIDPLDFNKGPTPAVLPRLYRLYIGGGLDITFNASVARYDRVASDKMATEILKALHSLYPNLGHSSAGDLNYRSFRWKAVRLFKERYIPGVLDNE